MEHGGGLGAAATDSPTFADQVCGRARNKQEMMDKMKDGTRSLANSKKKGKGKGKGKKPGLERTNAMIEQSFLETSARSPFPITGDLREVVAHSSQMIG